MAQRIDWKSMPHEDLVRSLEEGCEERDARVKALQSVDKPTRRLRNGAAEQPEASS
jgi:hypothetical protein